MNDKIYTIPDTDKLADFIIKREKEARRQAIEDEIKWLKRFRRKWTDIQFIDIDINKRIEKLKKELEGK